jgi:4-hydroxy-tetrahydrodipicolinate reductase
VTQERIRTIHYGVGAIGAEVVRLCLNRPEVEIVGAIDAHPAKAGRDLGEAVGANRTLGIPVVYEAEPLLRDVYADVVIHSTGSSLTTVYPQLLSIIAAEKSVISSCEELSFPWVRQPEISRRLDRRARETGVRVLGTGVNPGFVMDFLPLVLATACQEVRSIHVQRIVDVSTRRMQLQRKVGVGLSLEGFQRGAGEGSIGHVGLRESLIMIADTMGWRLDDVHETIEPVIARSRVATEFFAAERGYVIGLRQTVRSLSAGREVVRLDLEMSAGARNPRDVIRIEGVPPITVEVPGGLQGDQATAAIMTNCIPAVTRSRAVGLLSMRDMPVIPYLRPRPQPREEIE